MLHKSLHLPTWMKTLLFRWCCIISFTTVLLHGLLPHRDRSSPKVKAVFQAAWCNKDILTFLAPPCPQIQAHLNEKKTHYFKCSDENYSTVITGIIWGLYWHISEKKLLQCFSKINRAGVLHSHILKTLLRMEIFISCTALQVGINSCFTATS